MILKVCPCSEMQRFVLLSRDDRKVEQVGTTDNVTLKFNVVRKMVFYPIVDFIASDSDLFFSFRIDNVPRTNVGVF